MRSISVGLNDAIDISGFEGIILIGEIDRFKAGTVGIFDRMDIGKSQARPLF